MEINHTGTYAVASARGGHVLAPIAGFQGTGLPVAGTGVQGDALAARLRTGSPTSPRRRTPTP